MKSRPKRAIFRDVINEYLYPGADIKTSNGLIYAGFLTLLLVPLLIASPLPEIRAGQAPPSLPQPGQLYGGDRIDNLENQHLGEALSLIPDGLAPVSVFPPFPYERSVPAVAVIFSETPVANRRRGKRSIWNLATNLERNFACIRTRISRKFRIKRQTAMDSFDDCFEDVPEPLFGYVVKLRLKSEEPCYLKTCLSHLNITETSPKVLQRRNDEVTLVSNPECKVKNVCG